MSLDEREEEIDLLDLLLPIVRYKGFIIKSSIYGFLISALISLSLPSIYKSSAKLLPPQFSSSMSQVSSLITDLPIQIPGKIDYSTLYSELIKTNEVIDFVITKENLKGFYKEKDKERLREIVRINILTEINKKSNILTVSYLSKSPEISYKVVLSLIEGLKRLNNKLALTQASEKRLFYEEQLRLIREELIKAEDEIKRFQIKTGSIKMDEEMKLVVEEISTIRAKISAKEVELKLLKSYTTPDNPDYKKVVDEIEALKEQLLKIQSKLPSDEYILSVKKTSDYGIEYIRKMREFKYSETLYEMLLKQYEIARLEESREPSIIQIIEQPEIPDKRFKPKRRMIVALSTFTVFFLSIFIVFMRSLYENMMKDPYSLSKIDEIKGSLKSFNLLKEFSNDFAMIKKFFKR